MKITYTTPTPPRKYPQTISAARIRVCPLTMHQFRRHIINFFYRRIPSEFQTSAISTINYTNFNQAVFVMERSKTRREIQEKNLLINRSIINNDGTRLISFIFSLKNFLMMYFINKIIDSTLGYSE